jgi:hypothetical protein
MKALLNEYSKKSIFLKAFYDFPTVENFLENFLYFQHILHKKLTLPI